MGFKLLLLAALGLGALYLIHILAQDYMKIQKPAAKLARFLLTKRDLDAVQKATNHKEVERFDIDWDRILRNDPLKCAQSLICQIAAGAELHNNEANIIGTLVRYAMVIGAPKAIEIAHNRGVIANKEFEQCYKHYPRCPYSAKTMLKILEIYAYLFGG